MDRLRWVPHPTEVFIPATREVPFEADEDEEENVCYLWGQARAEVPRSEEPDLEYVEEEQLIGVRNLVDMPTVSPASVLETLKVRFGRDEIYTNCGTMLLCVNPLKELDLYSPFDMGRYQPERVSREPHIFGIGAAALQGLYAGEDQAVVGRGCERKTSES